MGLSGTSAQAAIMRLRLSLSCSFQGAVGRHLELALNKSRGCYALLPLYEPGYVAEIGKTTDGPGHGRWGRRETWGAKHVQATAEANLSCALAGATCRFFVDNPCRVFRVVKFVIKSKSGRTHVGVASGHPHGLCFFLNGQASPPERAG